MRCSAASRPSWASAVVAARGGLTRSGLQPQASTRSVRPSWQVRLTCERVLAVAVADQNSRRAALLWQRHYEIACRGTRLEAFSSSCANEPVPGSLVLSQAPNSRLLLGGALAVPACGPWLPSLR